MKKVLTIGGAMQDIFVHTEDIKTATLRHDTTSALRTTSDKLSEKSFIILQEGTKIEVSSIDV